MHTARIRKHGQVGPVIHNDGRLVPRGGLNQSIAEIQKRSRRKLFRAKLQQSRTTVEIGAGEIERRPPGVRRHVYIDDGVQRTRHQGPGTN